MEIERKFLIKKMPKLESFDMHQMEQGYLCTSPVVRIRRSDDSYYLTYKGSGLMSREEYNLPLTKESYEHLRPKTDGRMITKKRYLIPLSQGLTLELDVFEDDLAPLVLGEVEFESEEAAHAFLPPDWLGEDVTYDRRYHNSEMSKPDYIIPLPSENG
jgi:CYTH domain-containing protein